MTWDGFDFVLKESGGVFGKVPRIGFEFIRINS